jgi:hypothetical protein
MAMPREHIKFSDRVKREALKRQKFGCALCGERIDEPGEKGAVNHKYGERSEGHHVVPNKVGGPATEENCVVLCRACHSNVHLGGRTQNVEIYADFGLTEKTRKATPQQITKVGKEFYKNYNGSRTKRSTKKAKLAIRKIKANTANFRPSLWQGRPMASFVFRDGCRLTLMHNRRPYGPDYKAVALPLSYRGIQ